MNHTILISLVDQLTPMLRALAQQLFWDEATAEDLVQTTFLALARLPEPPRYPKAWSWETLRKLAAAFHRQKFRREKRERKVALLESETWDPLEGLAHSEAMGQVWNALETLDSADRELLVAILWGNSTFMEAAKVLGGSASNLHRRYHQILDQLRLQIKEGHHVEQK